jgi:hypothetical protein
MDNVITRDSVCSNELLNIIKAMETDVETMKAGNLSCSEKWMNGETVMKRLGVSKRTLQNYRDNRNLPYSAVGGKFYYNIRDIENLMLNKGVAYHIENMFVFPCRTVFFDDRYGYIQ